MNHLLFEGVNFLIYWIAYELLLSGHERSQLAAHLHGAWLLLWGGWRGVGLPCYESDDELSAIAVEIE